MEQRRVVRVDARDYLETLETITESHARLIQSLRSALVRIRRDTADVELQRSVLAGLRRLRVLRRRVIEHLGGVDVNPDDVDIVLEGPEQVVEHAATLSEYMLIVAIPAEEEVLKRVLLLARRGAEELRNVEEVIKEDIELLKRLSRLLEIVVEKYYR